MVAAIAKWGTMTGIWATAPNAQVDVSLIAVTDLNPAGENGIDRVEFSRVVNGGAPTVITVSSPSIRTPNYSGVSSPVSSILDNVADGRMTSFYGYGITIDCATVGFGTIEVTAVVYSNAGTATNVSGTITVYNDTDGTDRRPSPKTIFAAANGSDTGAGTIGDPASLRRAVNLCAATPGGSTSAQRDAGGAIVYMLDGDYDMWGPATVTAAPIHTSGHWWITFIAGPAVTITRGPTLTVADFIDATGNGAGTHYRMRFMTSAQWYGNGPVWNKASGVDTHIWIDGGYSGSAEYDGADPWSVDYTGSMLTLGFNNGTTADRFYASCHTRVGCTAGFHDWGWQQDCLFTDMTGVVMQCNASQPGEQAINCIVQRHRYAQNAVSGYVDSILQGNVTVVATGNGFMGIIATGTTKQTIFSAGDGETFLLSTQCADLVGNAQGWRLRCSGFGAGNNGDFVVTAVGDYFGQPLVVLANPSAVTETPASTARITTVSSVGITYRDSIHTDILQMLVGGTDRLYYGVVGRDLQYLRGFVDSTGTNTRVAFVNCTDGGSDINNDIVRPMIDCLFIHCNFARFFGNNQVATGTNFVDCVFLAVANVPTTGVYATNNHFVIGSTFGSNATTGTWYDTDTTVDPWTFRPDAPNLDTGSGLYPAPAAWRWTGSSGDSRGAWAKYGDLQTDDDVVTTISDLPNLTVGIPAATASTSVQVFAFGIVADLTIGIPTVTVDAGAPPVVVETTATTRLAGGGSSRGGPPDTNLKKGNPLKDLPLPRGSGFQPLPKFWRHLP